MIDNHHLHACGSNTSKTDTYPGDSGFDEGSFQFDLNTNNDMN